MDLAISPAQALRAQGDEAMRNGDPTAAETAYRATLAIDPRDIYALIGLGMAARLEGKREGALRYFREAAAIWPAHPWPLLEISAELKTLNQLDDAEAALREALRHSPDHYFVLLALGRLLRQRGKAAQAAEFLRGAIAADPAQNAPQAELAQLLAEPALPEDMQRRDAALTAARTARDRQDRAAAIGFLEQALQLDPANLPARRDLADLHRASQNYREAETHYLGVLREKPADLAALGGLAIVQRQLGRHADALAVLQQAAIIDPNNDWIRYEHGITLRDMGRSGEASTMLQAIGPESSMFVWSRMTLGHIARAEGAHQPALEFFEQAAGAASDPTDALYQMVSEKRALGDLPGAASVVAQMLARDPNAYRGHMADALLKRASGEFEAARAAFAHAATLAPSEPQPHVEHALEERRLGNYAAAITAIDAALNIDPRHEDALLKKATFLTDHGEITEALEIYAQLREARPGSVWAYLEAAQLLSDRGEVSEATALLAAARTACAKTPEIDLRDAGLLRRHGFPDQAFHLLTLAHARHPQNFWPWYFRAAAATDLGMFDLAEALLSAPPPVSAQNRARMLSARAQFDKANWALEAAIAGQDAVLAADPNDLTAIYERAKLKLISFDLTGARTDLAAHASLRSSIAQREGRSPNLSQSHVGQLYEEFILDRRLTPELTAAAALPPTGQVQKFTQLVREFPESTAPAMGLMIALRRAGQLNRTSAASGDTPSIPRLITQFWNDSAPPPDISALMQSWAAAEPEFHIEIFDDNKALAYLHHHISPAAARAFRMAPEATQRADLFRLARLYREGGYYIDADDRARGGLTAHVPPGTTFFAYQEDLGSIGNNILGTIPRHPVIGHALRQAIAALTRDDRDIVWLSTGPGLLTRALTNWLATEPEALDTRLADVTILTLAEMRCVSAMFCHAAYKATHRAWLNAAFPKRKLA